MQQGIRFDAELIQRYDRSGPRYTSYPPATQFDDAFGPERYAEIARGTNTSGSPLSLYIHIPFCDTVCFYCGCNKVVTKDRSRAAPYLERVASELRQQAELFDDDRRVEQLHWGGGTPTFISHEEMGALMGSIGECFELQGDDQGEYSIEIDPREADAETIALLRELGFNRLSLGVQDFDPKVQRAVNRLQGEAETIGVMQAARSAGFRSISVDLIYGLPLQSVESFGSTVDKVIAARPDRLSVFNYAHLPELFKPQRRINPEELPSPAEKLGILKQTIDQLTEAGYVYIGMDHFALPDDELAVAQRNRTLYRNFQGYSTHADCDLIGIGSTSIGMVGDCYAQNLRTLDEYYAALDAGRLAVFRGVELDADDRLRRAVISGLICHFVLDYADIEARFGIEFARYFDVELEELRQMERDDLIRLDDCGIQVTEAGRLLIRNICMVFDRYLRERNEQRFSRVI
ncbi:MAG: oxygen-independent coproporphyrinogen III oxidase [Chromatiales bacterium]